MVSARFASCWPVDSTRCRYSQLRQSYITPHFIKWPPVVTLKLHLVPPTAGAPSRVYKTGVMQNCLRWSGRTAVGAPRSLARPTRHRLHALVAIVALWPQSGATRSVLVSGLRPVITCVPLPCHRRAQGTVQGLRDRPHQASCLRWRRCTFKHAMADHADAKAKDKWERKGCKKLGLTLKQGFPDCATVTLLSTKVGLSLSLEIQQQRPELVIPS